MHLVKLWKHIPKPLLMFLLISLVWCTADYMFELNLPTYMESVGLSYVEIGFLLAIGSVGGLIIDLPLGAISDLVSRRRLLIYGLVILAISAIMIFSFNVTPMLALSMLVFSVGFEMWRVPRDAQFAAITKKMARGEEYGMDLEVSYLGQTLGPILGGVILLAFGFSGIMVAYIFLLTITAMLILLFMEQTNNFKMERAVYNSVTPTTFREEYREFKLLGIAGIILFFYSMLFTAWEQIFLSLVPLFYGPGVLNMSANLGGLFLACFSLPGIFLGYFTGRISDKVGRKPTLMAGLIIMGISLLLFSFAQGVIFAFGTALLISVGWITAMPALNSYLVDLTYKQRKGKICGMWNIFRNIGFIIGPIAGGLIAEATGLRSTFLVLGIIFLLAVFPLLIIKSPTAEVEPKWPHKTRELKCEC